VTCAWRAFEFARLPDGRCSRVLAPACVLKPRGHSGVDQFMRKKTARRMGVFLVVVCLTGPFGAAAEGPSAAAPGRAIRLEISPSQPGGLFSLKDRKDILFAAGQVPEGVARLSVRLAWKDARGGSVDGLPRRLDLDRAGAFKSWVELPSRLGFYDVRWDLDVIEGGSRRDTSSGTFSCAVIPDNPIRAKQPESPFGINTHFNANYEPELGRIIAKAGIAWIRDGGATFDDRAVAIARTNRLCYMPCFTWYHKPEQRHRKQDNTWDFSDVAEMHRKYAAKFGPDVDAYDLMNEPETDWIQVCGGSYVGGPWLEAFTQYGRQITAALKAGDPKAKVIWEDTDLMTYYRWFHRGGAAESIHAISPHTYNGERVRPLPEEQVSLEFLGGYHRFVTENRLSWKLWTGEVGFSTFRLDARTPVKWYTPLTELQQAQQLVRVMVMQFARGVDKIFWYELRDYGGNPSDPENCFGIIHRDASPKPAIVACAMLIDRSKGCTWLGAYPLDGGCDAYVFRSATGKPVILAWLRRGECDEDFPVFSDVREVTITDVFGASTTCVVKDRMIAARFTETPVFIEGLKDEDVVPYLAWRTPAR
jgi:hypothetical protein